MLQTYRYKEASSKWKLDIARRLAFASQSRTKKATYSAQQRLYKTECHSALDRLDFDINVAGLCL